VADVGGEAVLKLREDAKEQDSTNSNVKAANPIEAIRLILDAVCKPGMATVQAVGYRVVHPGPKLNQHQIITADVLRDLEEAATFAPLHDPEAITVIRECMARFPHIAHYACFDTVFHETMPAEASTYPIPLVYRDIGARRYGFHGLSCESVVLQLRARTRTQDVGFPRRMIIAHLGSGCSVTALLDGASIDTTMGLTPTGGVVMATRSGDVDPGLIFYLLRQQTGDTKDSIASLERAFNHSSGIAGLSGKTGDVKTVREAAATGDAMAVLAMKIFTRSVIKAIGEHDEMTRADILANLQDLGVAIDVRPNRAKSPALRQIGTATSNTTVYVVPSQEDRMIAVHVQRMSSLKK
jgi:acetate kinase